MSLPVYRLLFTDPDTPMAFVLPGRLAGEAAMSTRRGLTTGMGRSINNEKDVWTAGIPRRTRSGLRVFTGLPAHLAPGLIGRVRHSDAGAQSAAAALLSWPSSEFVITSLRQWSSC